MWNVHHFVHEMMQGGWSRSPCCRHHRRREENQFVGNLTLSSVDQDLEKQASPFFHLFFILRNLHLEEVYTTDNTHCNNLQNKVTWYLYRQSSCRDQPQHLKHVWNLFCACRNWQHLEQVRKQLFSWRNQQDLEQIRNLFYASRNQQDLKQVRNLFCACRNQ